MKRRKDDYFRWPCGCWVKGAFMFICRKCLP